MSLHFAHISNRILCPTGTTEEFLERRMLERRCLHSEIYTSEANQMNFAGFDNDLRAKIIVEDTGTVEVTLPVGTVRKVEHNLEHPI